MSTIKHPVGPQSEKVYRRRRAVVGLVVLAVIVIIVLIIVRPGSDSSKPAGAPASATQPTDTAADSATPPKAGGACDPAQVQVDALTDLDSYAVDQLPQLTLSVTNTGPVACTLNAGTSKQVYTITSGTDVWWTSTDCQTDSSDAEVTLEPNTPLKTSTPLEWQRIRSSPDTCDAADREAAPAGGASYRLSVSVDGIESASPTQFLLD
ncbi:hypothetical protein [Glaciibacter psychrotolerans]|uniref:DUF4232 domain-containing protein n=1 Tax=Glaciibacter psychrotolerans TaxID=670054 RepID=A0A7Z0EH78_9MICO|nr:hypothetical protein [Leifsonia psychrotolerans]NYJ21448.1 hypothetical protein [Leifsonia psychrotolerans]